MHFHDIHFSGTIFYMDVIIPAIHHGTTKIQPSKSIIMQDSLNPADIKYQQGSITSF